jgi:signal transduction histidine kinase
MFSLFFSSKGSKGTGLGLYIVHNVIQQHGGTIKVESTPGKGSKFIVSIPRSNPLK